MIMFQHNKPLLWCHEYNYIIIARLSVTGAIDYSTYMHVQLQSHVTWYYNFSDVRNIRVVII